MKEEIELSLLRKKEEARRAIDELNDVYLEIVSDYKKRKSSLESFMSSITNVIDNPMQDEAFDPSEVLTPSPYTHGLMINPTEGLGV